VRAQQKLVANASCVTNYECAITASNTPPGAATAGLVVQSLYECTGTLINDVPGDNIPYMLTARHCVASPRVRTGPPSLDDLRVVSPDDRTGTGS